MNANGQILIDFRTNGKKMTISQVFDYIKKYQDEHPYEEVYMDGDRFAIVSKARVSA